jgi:hypothetical protein
MLIEYFPLEFLLKVLLMYLWMNAKVWDFIWGIFGFIDRHIYLFWGWTILSFMLYVTATIMEKREAKKAKKKTMGKG